MISAFKPLIRSSFNTLVKLATRPKRGRKKLLIVQIAGIGDLLLLNPALPHFRRFYPDYHITLMVNGSYAPLIQSCPFIDDIMEYPENKLYRNLKLRWQFFTKIRKAGFDIVIYPYRSRSSSVEEMIFLTGAKEIVSYEGDTCNSSLRVHKRNNRRYSRLFPRKEDMLHEMEAHRVFLEWLSDEHIVEEFKPVIWPSISEDECLEKIARVIDKNLLKGDYIVFFPGAKSKIRVWPASRYIDIGNLIKKHYPQFRIVVCGGQNETDMAENICSNIGEDTINACGKTTLVELAYLINNAVLCLGSETGALHMAVSVNTPNICVAGGGYWGRFVPHKNSAKNKVVYRKMDCFGCNWTCRHDRVLCIEGVKTHQVWETINEVLGENHSFEFLSNTKKHAKSI